MLISKFLSLLALLVPLAAAAPVGRHPAAEALVVSASASSSARASSSDLLARQDDPVANGEIDPSMFISPPAQVDDTVYADPTDTVDILSRRNLPIA
ncbi:hypothetical protein DFS34DRAFT_636209 [Phlyctochytrium arcticum]|nr:hypothetical protein DFS34DRAFT_636209 [Phlyctochytrium arcticum]